MKTTKTKTTATYKDAVSTTTNKGAIATKLASQEISKWKQPTPQRDYILLDCSGSMASNWRDALAAVNGYVHSLGSRLNTKILLATFADTYTVLREDQSPLNWKSLTEDVVTPDGGTALNDAIGKIVGQAMKDNPDKAAIVLCTDGVECASQEVTTQQAKALLEQCRQRGWQVIHLHIGSAANAQVISAIYGIDPNQTIAAGKETVATVLQKTAEKRIAYGKGQGQITFTESEKKTLLLK
jgi:uncharacterized protein with von Willebrand factor type A (vWA) domain